MKSGVTVVSNKFVLCVVCHFILLLVFVGTNSGFDSVLFWFGCHLVEFLGAIDRRKLWSCGKFVGFLGIVACPHCLVLVHARNIGTTRCQWTSSSTTTTAITTTTAKSTTTKGGWRRIYQNGGINTQNTSAAKNKTKQNQTQSNMLIILSYRFSLPTNQLDHSFSFVVICASVLERRRVVLYMVQGVGCVFQDRSAIPLLTNDMYRYSYLNSIYNLYKKTNNNHKSRPLMFQRRRRRPIPKLDSGTGCCWCCW